MKTPALSMALAFLLYLPVYSHAQTDAKPDYDKIVESKNYVFKVENINPNRGGTRPVLSNDYDVTVLPDSIISYLPFFGRAFVAPVDPSKGGIQFTSTDFTYTAKKKKNHWEIVMLFKDQNDTRQFNLDVYEGGRADLRVNNTNRESISFNGYIEEGKPRDKRAF